MTQTAEPGIGRPERELGDIIESYNLVTERLEQSHRQLTGEVARLRAQLDEKNRELARKERLAALGEMAAGVAHEVRNPLGAIQLYAAMLDRDLNALPDAQQLVQKIASAVSALDGIVGDILAFAGRSELDLQPVRLSEIVDEAVALATPQKDALQATLHVSEQVRSLVVRGDDRELTRMLVNLVFNALDAAGEDGHVWVDAGPAEDGWVALQVADDGPGVVDEVKQRIFNPFFTTKDTGTGLGLSIVHRIAEAHGGRVEVSDRDGGGAVFALTLPAGGSEGDSDEFEEAT